MVRCFDLYFRFSTSFIFKRMQLWGLYKWELHSGLLWSTKWLNLFQVFQEFLRYNAVEEDYKNWFLYSWIIEKEKICYKLLQRLITTLISIVIACATPCWGVTFTQTCYTLPPPNIFSQFPFSVRLLHQLRQIVVVFLAISDESYSVVFFIIHDKYLKQNLTRKIKNKNRTRNILYCVL